MSAITDFLAKHKVTIGVVGTTVVVATAYGSCEFTPELPVEEAAVEEVTEASPHASDEDQEEAAEEEQPLVE